MLMTTISSKRHSAFLSVYRIPLLNLLRRSESRVLTKRGTPKVFAPPVQYGWGFATQSYENMSDRSDELAVLDYRAARQECGQ